MPAVCHPNVRFNAYTDSDHDPHMIPSLPDAWSISQNVFDGLQAFVRSRLSVSPGVQTYLFPLDDYHFNELCMDVYQEAACRQYDVLCRKDLRNLFWLPENIFNGLARDIYFELCKRHPELLWSRQTAHKPRTTSLQRDQFYISSNGQKLKRSTRGSSLPDGVPAPVFLLELGIPGSGIPTVTREGKSEPSTFSISPTRHSWGESSPALSLSDALEYLDSIKNRFQNNPNVYNSFMGIISDFRNQRADVSSLTKRVLAIFTSYPALIEGFFLPPVYPTEYFLSPMDVKRNNTETKNTSLMPDRDEFSDHTPMHIAAQDPSRVSASRRSEPFSKYSRLCLDGQIIRRSSYAVASGGYADVWVGTLQDRLVAIKTMRPFSSLGTPIQQAKLLKRLWREYLAWSSLSHPNILKCLGFSYDFTPQSRYEIPSLISHWMSNGTVLSYIENRPKVDRLKLIVGIAQGLSYLHGRNPGIVHGDLRAGNILVSDTGDPCLTDFGLSRILSDTRGMTTSSEPAGSVRWMSPELFNEDRASESSDVWAFGMTMLEISSGKRPYDELNLEPVVLRHILEGRLPSRPVDSGVVPGLSDEVWAICQKCWILQPRQRSSMRQVTSNLIKVHYRGNSSER